MDVLPWEPGTPQGQGPEGSHHHNLHIMWGQESLWEQGQGLFKKRAQNLHLCTGQGLCGAQAPPGIAPGHIQAQCPCWLFQEKKPPHSHHIGPLTLNTCIPKGPLRDKGSKVNASKLGSWLLRNHHSVQHRKRRTNCRCGFRIHSSPFSTVIPSLWLQTITNYRSILYSKGTKIHVIWKSYQRL